MAYKQRANTSDNRRELTKSNVIAAAVTPYQKAHLKKRETDETEQQKNPPAVTIQEDSRTFVHAHFRQGNKEAGENVENEQGQIEDQPYAQAMAFLFVRKWSRNWK